MSDDVARMLYEGAVAVTEGRKAEAQELLMKVVELDEQNELGWLWLSGAVDDPADQQVALENVLAVNPHNAAARQGLELLSAVAAPIRALSASSQPALPTDADEWTPPPPFDPEDAVELACWQCEVELYSVAKFCWQCHAPVHCCNNCVYRFVSRCKELQRLTSTMAQSSQNTCEWWRPPAALSEV